MASEKKVFETKRNFFSVLAGYLFPEPVKNPWPAAEPPIHERAETTFLVLTLKSSVLIWGENKQQLRERSLKGHEGEANTQP